MSALLTPRERLPNRRASETFEYEVSGQKYIATASRFHDGRLGELFINSFKSNSQADIAAHESAVAFSIAVQSGADPEVIRCAVPRNSRGRALGPLGHALDIQSARHGGRL